MKKARIQGKPPDQRLHERKQKLNPAFGEWHRFPQTAADHFARLSLEASAIHYGFAEDAWSGFCRFPADGRIAVHADPVENVMRPVKLTRRNALFAGSTDALDTWARAKTLIAT